VGKGHLVREVDAMGGLMAAVRAHHTCLSAKEREPTLDDTRRRPLSLRSVRTRPQVADEAAIHFRLLNRSKGPAVRGPRVQADRSRYRRAMQAALSNVDYLRLVEASVEDLIVEGGAVRGVITAAGVTLRARSVVLTTGTFLRGEILLGRTRRPAGRMARQSGGGEARGRGGNGGAGGGVGGGGGSGGVARSSGVELSGGRANGGVGGAMGAPASTASVNAASVSSPYAMADDAAMETEPSSVGVAATLARLGLPLSRLKTGTPPRLDGRTIQWGSPSLIAQPSEDPPTLLSYANALRGRPIAPGVVTCFMAHTSDETLRVVRENAGMLPEYRGELGIVVVLCVDGGPHPHPRPSPSPPHPDPFPVPHPLQAVARDTAPPLAPRWSDSQRRGTTRCEERKNRLA
jgi:tRNA uridine 5-carboxymethylaminomethyl modification enzyme